MGQLIAEVRCLVRDLHALLPADDALLRRCCRRTVAFAHALREQLRGTSEGGASPWLDEAEWSRVKTCRSTPDAVLRALTDDLRRLRLGDDLSDIAYQTIAERL